MADYGTVEGVAAIASTWTRDGEFFDEDLIYDIPATNPPLSTVEAWITSMSALMDAALKDNYFVTPLTDTYAVSYANISQQVNMLVADLVASRNQQGRFYTQSDQGGRNVIDWAKIQAEVINVVRANVETFLSEEVPQITVNQIRPGQTAVILQDDEFDE